MLRPVKFNEIISKYKQLQQKLKGISVHSFHEMYTQVRLENGQKGNIIEFYNKIYIRQMKVHIMSLDPRSNKMQVSPKPKIWALAPKSPLRENLPPAYLTYSTIYSSKGKIFILCLLKTSNIKDIGSPRYQGLMTPGMRQIQMMAMTPRTKTLYSFGESQTYKLDEANKEIRKNLINLKPCTDQISFGTGLSKGNLYKITSNHYYFREYISSESEKSTYWANEHQAGRKCRYASYIK